jgi:ECF transporter S component (folate family)
MVSHPLLQMSTSHIVVKRICCLFTWALLLSNITTHYGGVFFMQKFKESLQEFRNIKVLCAIGMLGALSIIINNFSIQIGDFLKIGFASECNVLVDCLFGPAAGAIFGAGMDILKFLIKPTGPFFWGWTFSAALAGVIIGFGLYKKKITYVRVFIVRLINSLVINVILGTYWLDVMYGKGFIALLPSRLFKNVIMVPIEAFIFIAIYKAIEKGGIIHMLRQASAQNK